MRLTSVLDGRYRIKQQLFKNERGGLTEGGDGAGGTVLFSPRKIPVIGL